MQLSFHLHLEEIHTEKWTNQPCLHFNYKKKNKVITTLIIPAVSHSYHKNNWYWHKQIFWKLWIGPYYKWSVYVCLHVCLYLLPSLSVGWECFMQGNEMSRNYRSSAAQCSSLTRGTGRQYSTFTYSSCVLCTTWGKGERWGGGLSSGHPSSPLKFNNTHLSTIHLRF